MARQRREVGFPGRVHRVVRFEIATDPVEHLATACLGAWLDAVVEEHQARTAGRGFLQRLRSILLERVMAIATGAEHEDRVCLVNERGIARPSLEAGGHRQARNGLQSFLQQVDARVVLVLQRSVTGLVGDQKDLLATRARSTGRWRCLGEGRSGGGDDACDSHRALVSLRLRSVKVEP